MSTTEAAFNTDKIGEWSEPLEFDIEKERIQAYAAATNDPIAQHVAGEFAPPVFSIVPAFQVSGMAMMSVVPGEYLMRVVHGEQDFRFHAPLLPGTKVTSRARAIGLRQRSSGVTCTVLAETRDAASDELLTEQYLVSFFRGVEGAPDVGDAPPEHSLRRVASRDRATGRGRSDLRRRPDLSLRRGLGRPDADPHRREHRQGRGPAGDHHPRALHHGLHLRRGDREQLRRMIRSGWSASPCASPRSHCPSRRSRPACGARRARDRLLRDLQRGGRPRHQGRAGGDRGLARPDAREAAHTASTTPNSPRQSIGWPVTPTSTAAFWRRAAPSRGRSSRSSRAAPPSRSPDRPMRRPSTGPSRRPGGPRRRGSP